MDLTSQAVLGRWLIDVLGEHGGRAHKQRALTLMSEKYGALLTEDDWLPQPSQQEPKWQNQTAWQRNKLVEAGLLQRPAQAGLGFWALTDGGWRVFEQSRDR